MHGSAFEAIWRSSQDFIPEFQPKSKRNEQTYTYIHKKSLFSYLYIEESSCILILTEIFKKMSIISFYYVENFNYTFIKYVV